MAYYKGNSGTFFVETRSLETGRPVTVDANTVSMAVYKENSTQVSWEFGVDYEITSITGGLMVYVENLGANDSISFFFSCTDASVYIPMVCIELSDNILGPLTQIFSAVNETAKTSDIPSLEAIADAVLTTQFGTYQLKAESGNYSTLPLTAEFAMSLAAQGVMNGGLLTKRTVDSITDLTSLSKYARVEIAAPSDIESSKDEIIAACATATGFATPADVQLTTTTETVEVISQTVDLSGMATLANQQAILTDLATIRTTTNDISKDVSSVYSYVTEISEIPEAVWNYGEDYTSRTVKANGVSLEGTDLSVSVDSAEIANRVWNNVTRTLTDSTLANKTDIDDAVEMILEECKTSTGFATPSDVNMAQNSIISQCRTASGFATPANVTAAQSAIIAQCKTASGFATPEDVKLTTTTQTVEVVSQSVDLTGIAKIDDIETAKNAVISACKTATGFSTPQDVKDAQEAILAQSGRVDVEEVAQAVWEYGGTPEERTVKATGIEIGGDVSVDVDPDKIAEAVWTAENRTLTGYTPIAPDDISGSCYCTRDDVERRWGVMNVRRWADLDNDDDELKIRAQIDWAILSATSRIESDFASYIYKLPFNPVPLEVRRHASALAGVELFNCRAMAATNDSPTIQRAENEYFEWKTKIFSGIEIAGAERKE